MKFPLFHILAAAAMMLTAIPPAWAQTYDPATATGREDNDFVERQREQQARQLSKRQQKKARIDTRKSETYTVPVYMFAISNEFGDSAVYITGVQEVENARLTSKYDYLYFRSEYSYQFNKYLSEAFRTQNQTTSILFDKDKKKLVKRYLKVMKQYESDPESHIVLITADHFHFKAVDD